MFEVAPRATRIFGLFMEPPKKHNPKANKFFKVNLCDFKYS